MKVLFYTKKIYEPAGGLFLRDHAGLAMYVHDIAEEIQNDVDLHVLTSIPCKGVDVGNIHYVKYSKADFISCITFRGLVSGIKKAISLKKGSIRQRLKEIYWEIDRNYFNKLVKRLKPDVVHIHGCTENITGQVEYCSKQSIPCIVTLHGLIGIDPTVIGSQELKAKEGEILRYMEKHQMPVSTISSGVKKRAIDFYALENSANIRVIINGTRQSAVQCTSDSADIKKAYGIAPDKKVICCVGGLSTRKNQLSLVEAWAKTDARIRGEHELVFAGGDILNGALQRRIKDLNLEDSIKYVGFVSREELSRIYGVSVLNVIASVDEGFGLSIIEAMQYGIPTLTYADLDAIPDVYDEKCMIALNDRSMDALVAGLKEATERDWDHDEIRRIAQKYQLSEIVKQYVALYREMLEDKYGRK